MPKPDGYPLPWCDFVDAPYWQVNMYFIHKLLGWRSFQSQKLMKDIIPVIDWINEGVMNMNTENTTDTAAVDTAAAAPSTDTDATTLTIRSQVRERISNVGERTREAVIEHFAQQEADKQAKALIGGLDKLDAAERDLRKIRPQNTGFDAEGKPVGEPVFTKEQVEERKKLNEQIRKLTNAINKADDKGDFGDLFNLSK